VRFMRGLGHLVSRVRRCLILPIAIEYPFWEERFPEALARCGPWLKHEEAGDLAPDALTELLEKRLETTLDALAADSMSRNAAAFKTILRGRAGVGGVYDVWRRLVARLRGETFRAEHGRDRT